MASANKAWVDLLKALHDAPVVSPRGFKTKELIGYQSRVSMSDPMVCIREREIGEKFRYAEAAWILSGDNKVSTIAPYSKMIPQFSDDGVRFFGAYGVKVADQLSYVVSSLATDNSTRQAIINIWRENPRPSKDIPCTLSLQFLIRNNKLHCNATMRSSDAWLGWVYDVYNFSQISLYVLLQLKSQHKIKLELGESTLTAGSQHIYQQHWKPALKCIYGSPYLPDKLITNFENGEDLISHLWNRAGKKESDTNQLVLVGIE